MKIIRKVVLLSFLTGLLLMSANIVGIMRFNSLYSWASLVCWTIFLLAVSVLFTLLWSFPEQVEETLNWKMPVVLKWIMAAGVAICSFLFLMIPGMVLLIPPIHKLLGDKSAWNTYFRIWLMIAYCGPGILCGTVLFALGVKYREKMNIFKNFSDFIRKARIKHLEREIQKADERIRRIEIEEIEGGSFFRLITDEDLLKMPERYWKHRKEKLIEKLKTLRACL